MGVQFSLEYSISRATISCEPDADKRTKKLYAKLERLVKARRYKDAVALIEPYVYVQVSTSDCDKPWEKKFKPWSADTDLNLKSSELVKAYHIGIGKDVNWSGQYALALSVAVSVKVEPLDTKQRTQLDDWVTENARYCMSIYLDGVALGLTEDDGDDVSLYWQGRGEYRLHEAVLAGQYRKLKRLLDKSMQDLCPPNEYGHLDFTPIAFALLRDEMKCFNVLLACPEVNLFKGSTSGQHTVNLAILWKRPEAVRLLIERTPALLNAKGVDGETPLICAAGIGDLATVRWLLMQPQIDVHAKDKRGVTALKAACDRAASFPVMQAIIEAFPEVLDDHPS